MSAAKKSKVTTTIVTIQSDSTTAVNSITTKYYKGLSFWMVFLGICICSLLALLEATITSNALPTIVSELSGSNYVWVGSGYTLAAAAVMPPAGVLTQIFGRKAVMLGSVVVFSTGCAVCGAAHSMDMLIAGRVVQGVGGAGILNTSYIIVSDIVPLSERGLFNGLLQITWCIASGIGPVVGGTLAQRGNWRWIFYLNLPIAPVAGFLVVMFLKLKVPRRTWQENLQQLDIIGNVLIIGGTCLFALGLTWGGIYYRWDSAHVLATICIGGVMLVLFMIYEYFWSPNPMVPAKLMLNRTTLSGFLQIMICPIPFFAGVYYLPLYLQACKAFTPIHSGIVLLAFASSAPLIALLAGVSVTLTKRYRPFLWSGWVLSVISLVLMGTLHADTSLNTFIGYEIIAGAGFGLVLSCIYYPILAPLPLTSTSQALAFLAFFRQFTQIWGITIGGVILQNQLTDRLPNSILDDPTIFGGGRDILSLSQNISKLPSDQLLIVQRAFADSLQLVWKVMAGVTGIGLAVSLMMRHYVLHTKTDENWGLKEEKPDNGMDLN